jgi:dihydroorotate dehydrogenase electron transfer subunit
VEKEIIRYVDLVKFLESKNLKESQSIDKLFSKTFNIIPKSIKNELSNYADNKKFRATIGKKLSNKKSYNTFCLNILNIIISKLDIKACFINDKYFFKPFLLLRSNGQTSITNDKKIAENCAFILKNKATNLIFSFGHQGAKSLHELTNHIYSIDSNKYENIHIIIFKNSEELNEARLLNKAKLYKRCFFTSFEEICTKAIELDKVTYEKIFSSKWSFVKDIHKNKNIAGLSNVEIIDNIPIGKNDSKLYKLTFISEDAIDIKPGQFIMVRTLKEQNEITKYYTPKKHSSISDISTNIQNELITKQISFLKRPFGIYRTHYEHFNHDYLLKLNLKKELADILYTIKPNKFEIIYKVLDRGVGTNELTKLVRNDKVEILAPLGKIFDLRELLKEDIDEIHIVGGGVGIAPLVYFAQVFRHYNINVKAFIGVENYNSIIYKGLNTKSPSNSVKDARIYIDDLKYIGLSDISDIYLSFMCDPEKEQLNDIKNVFNGCMVTEPYAEYLKKHNNLKIFTFTCGPIPMMQKVHNITAQYNIKSYVLMEKRMACGIGVCFSCVCKTIENGENQNSRVCIDGPIFESKQINWNE